jgi:hypothetical protein
MRSEDFAEIFCVGKRSDFLFSPVISKNLLIFPSEENFNVYSRVMIELKRMKGTGNFLDEAVLKVVV